MAGVIAQDLTFLFPDPLTARPAQMQRRRGLEPGIDSPYPTAYYRYRTAPKTKANPNDLTTPYPLLSESDEKRDCKGSTHQRNLLIAPVVLALPLT